MELPRAWEAPRVENETHQPMESLYPNISGPRLKPIKRYIKECDYVTYASMVAIDVEGYDDPN